MPRRSKSAPRLVRAADRRQHAVELRKTGLSYDEIGRALGVSGVAAWKLVNTALKVFAELEHQATAELRELESQKLDELLVPLQPAIKTGDVRSIEAAVKISARRSALLGLDAPSKTELTGKDGGPIAMTWADQLIAAAKTDPEDA